jgi:hypothetical protein
MQSILPQERKSGCGRYNSDHTPSVLDCRATSSSVLTQALMAASSSCFSSASLGEGSALSSTKISGGTLDTGRAMSGVGYRQARASCNLIGVPYELSTGTRRFKFGDVVSEPYGTFTVPLRSPGGIVPLPIHVVPQNVPLPIGADILDGRQWYISNVTDELVSTAGWNLPIALWQGHYWLRHGFDELPASTRFTRTQLYHLHRHFRHPGAAKMDESRRPVT